MRACRLSLRRSGSHRLDGNATPQVAARRIQPSVFLPLSVWPTNVSPNAVRGAAVNWPLARPEVAGSARVIEFRLNIKLFRMRGRCAPPHKHRSWTQRGHAKPVNSHEPHFEGAGDPIPRIAIGWIGGRRLP